ERLGSAELPLCGEGARLGSGNSSLRVAAPDLGDATIHPSPSSVHFDRFVFPPLLVITARGRVKSLPISATEIGLLSLSAYANRGIGSWGAVAMFRLNHHQSAAVRVGHPRLGLESRANPPPPVRCSACLI